MQPNGHIQQYQTSAGRVMFKKLEKTHAKPLSGELVLSAMVLTSVQCWMSKFASALLLQNFALLQLGATKRDAEKSYANLTKLQGFWCVFLG